jgi:FkbM family methyltransferase
MGLWTTSDPAGGDGEGAAGTLASCEQLRESLHVAVQGRVAAATVLAIARYTKWLEPEMLGLSRLVQPGSVCIDVGAAAGLYTLPLSRLVGPSGVVHSIEPLPFAWPVWNRVLRVRTFPNVRHHTVAVGSEQGTAEMSVPIGRYGMVTGRSFISQRCRGLGSNAEFTRHISYPVNVDTLDGMFAGQLSRFDFVKIDVEGAELHVLEGGEKIIDEFKPTLLVEIEARHAVRYEYSPEDVVSWLTERGYAMYIWHQGWQRANAVKAETRNYMFCHCDRPAPVRPLPAVQPEQPYAVVPEDAAQPVITEAEPGEPADLRRECVRNRREVRPEHDPVAERRHPVG